MPGQGRRDHTHKSGHNHGPSNDSRTGRLALFTHIINVDPFIIPRGFPLHVLSATILVARSGSCHILPQGPTRSRSAPQASCHRHILSSILFGLRLATFTLVPGRIPLPYPASCCCYNCRLGEGLRKRGRGGDDYEEKGESEVVQYSVADAHAAET